MTFHMKRIELRARRRSVSVSLSAPLLERLESMVSPKVNFSRLIERLLLEQVELAPVVDPAEHELEGSVPVSQLRATLPQLLQHVEAAGSSFDITRYGQVIARLVPATPDAPTSTAQDNAPSPSEDVLGLG
jgi:antitoxin (DNA-binding transcriptional repressor) of toxin-antitoxin stability system